MAREELPPRFRKRPWTESFGDPIPFGKIVEAFSKNILKYKGTLLQAMLAFLVASILQSLVPLTMKFVIDRLFPSSNYYLLLMTALAVVALFMLRSVIQVLGHYMLIYTSTHVVFDVRRRLFEHLQLLHLAFYEREQSGKLVSKLINDVNALQMLIQSALPVLSVSVFQILVTLAIMCLLSVKLTSLAIVIVPLYALISHLFRKRLYRRAMEVRERNSVVAGNINEVITGIKVVKSFGMEDLEQRRFVRMIRENLDYEIDLASVNALRSNTLQFITGVALAATILVGGTLVFDQSLTIGEFVAFWTLLNMLYNPIIQIANLAIQSIQARTGLERVLHILNIRPEVVDRPRARVIEKIKGHVHLENITFQYNAESPAVLKNIELEAKPDEIVALVGPSGAGKSTIVNLLTRFYDPTEGRILIDGIDLRNIQLRSYRRRVGIVLQEPFLFSGSIFDNICYGKGMATYEEVEEAARQANALDFINELPDGMETQVGERGALLSGGQRQRISIARALLKDPDILILDEATSALDAQSEAKVQEALDRLMRGRTVFVIAHRLSTIQGADKIVVMDQGEIVEIGKHGELLERGGLYSELYSTHFRTGGESSEENMDDETGEEEEDEPILSE